MWGGHSCPPPSAATKSEGGKVEPRRRKISKQKLRSLKSRGVIQPITPNFRYPPSCFTSSQRVYDCLMKRITTLLCLTGVLTLAALAMQGCNSLNPLCGSARPAPSITALSATTVTFAQIQQGYLLTVTGTNILSSSEIEINGNIEATQIISNTEAQITLNDIMIPAVGAANVTLHTPGGNSSDAGCSSGGNSSALTLTITN
jgi:hypothetical protein